MTPGPAEAPDDRSAWWRSLGAAVAGFLVYGGWAYYVNADHGQSIGMRSGLLQGSYSFVLTLVTTLLMERLYRTFAAGQHPVVLTVIVTGVLLFTIPCVIHGLAGTPEILMTVLPGFLIGMVYTTVYTMSLSRLLS
ncbi:MAG: hypothetical protein AAGG11_14575 [Pseudomonadota bacterium]